MRTLLTWMVLGVVLSVAAGLQAEDPQKPTPTAKSQPSENTKAKSDDVNFLDLAEFIDFKDAEGYNDPSNPLNVLNYRKFSAGKSYFSNQQPYPYIHKNSTPDPIFGHGVIHSTLKPWYDLTQKAKTDVGLHLDISYTIWSQWASQALSIPGKATPNSMTNGRLDLGGFWEFKKNPIGSSRIHFLMRQGTNYGWSTGTTLDTSIGDISGVNGGYSPSISLNILSYEQDFFDGALSVQTGKVHPGMYFFVSPVADDETSQFTNGILDGSPNPVINNYAPGVIVRLNEILGNKDFYVYAAGIDMADSETTAMGGMCDGQWGAVMEMGYRPKFNGLQGNYRFDLWYTDNTKLGYRSGMGFGVNVDQEIVKNCILFGTYVYNGRESASQEHQLTGGVGILEPFNRRGEMFGIGGGWARATNNGHNEGVLETFYRFQLTDAIQFSPDIQVIFNPAENPDDPCVFVAGMRLKIQF